MKIKPSDIICKKEDFLYAKNVLFSEQKIENIGVKKIVTYIKYFSKKYNIAIDNFNERILLDKMKKSDDFSQVWIAYKIEEILWFNNFLDEHYYKVINSSFMVIEVSKDWKILSANDDFSFISWYSLKELIWMETKQLSWDFSKEKPKEFWEELRGIVLSWNVWNWKIKNQTKEWLYYRTDTTIVPKMDNNWEIEFFTVVRSNITETEDLRNDLLQKNQELEKYNSMLLQKNIELEILSMTDGLTWLYNRRAFDKKIIEELSRAERLNFDLSLIFFDIDHFKNINDAFWHDIWDLVLKYISEKLKIITRDTDFKFRIWWEEFAIILTWENLENTKNIAEKIRIFFEKLKIDWLPSFTISFGIATFNNKVNKIFSKELLFKKADDALYKAKKSWRNCVKTYLDI